MLLHKLEIQGFKSFARKKTLEFNSPSSRQSKGIVAVVGPNGSGKSNVSDAIRWALGEQSLKTLRGKKSEDIIFSGSSSLPRLGFAEVSLVFNNEDGQAPIDYSELMITRRIYRNGESEYLINKNKARLQDILILLAKANFGQSSYSIIGQGMIDAILRASPTERKDFFDEATGVKQFQIKREQALKKLENTIENLKQSELTIQEIEPRLKSLTRQIKRIERREIIEKELRALQNCHYSRLWKEIGEKTESQKIKVKNLEEESQKIQNESLDIQQEMEKLQKEDSRPKIFLELQKEYNEILERRNGLLREQTILKGKIDLEREKMGRLNLVWLEKNREKLEKEIMGVNQESDILKETVKSRQSMLEEKIEKQKNILAEIEKCENEIAKAKENRELSWPAAQKDLEQIHQANWQIQKDLDEITEIGNLGAIKESVRNISQKLTALIGLIKNCLAKKDYPLESEQEKLDEVLKTRELLEKELSALKFSLKIDLEKENLLREKIKNLTEEKSKVSAELEKNESIPLTKEEQLALCEKEKAEIENKIKSAEEEFRLIKDKLDNFNEEEQEKKEKLFACQKKSQDKQNVLNVIVSELNNLKIELAKWETRKEDLGEEIKRELNIPDMASFVGDEAAAEEILTLSGEEIIFRIQKLKSQLELIGGIDPETAKEYEETKKRFDFLSEQTNDLKEAIDSLKTVIKELNEKIGRQFRAVFEKINQEFQKYFQILFSGGSARLVLQKRSEETDESEAEENAEEGQAEEEAKTDFIDKILKQLRQFEDFSGIEIQATPPGKKLKNISVLSGGERALTSIALICAIISNNPSPFVVLDEVDAALDETNSMKFAEIIEHLSQRTQFVVITHNRSTMEKADVLYGVTMGEDGTSQLLSVNLEEAGKHITQNT